MLDDIATLIDTQLHDRYLEFKEDLKTENPFHLGARCRLKDAKITLCEAAGLFVLFQASRQPHFKPFLDWNRPALLRLFPGLPSYDRLNKWCGKCEHLMLALAQAGVAEPGDRLSTYLVDSTRRNGVPAAGVLRTSVRSTPTSSNPTPSASGGRPDSATPTKAATSASSCTWSPTGAGRSWRSTCPRPTATTWTP